MAPTAGIDQQTRLTDEGVCHSSGVLVFGCCIGPSGKFTTVAEPALEATMSPEDLLVREQGSDGICAAYNRVLDRARDIDGCEGVVLIHDDVALGAGARQQVLDGLRQPGVGVVGAVGGRGLFGPQWVDSRRRAGYADDFYGWRRYGPETSDVDVVDGLLLALSPAAFRTLDFDHLNFPAFHGYDTDYCLRVRTAGHRVLVVPVNYVHHDKGGFGDSDAFSASAATLRRNWPHLIQPLSRWERTKHELTNRTRQQAGRLRHRTAVALKKVRGGRGRE